MPNHCTNNLIVTGNKDDVQTFTNSITTSPNKKDGEPFSLLGHFIPQPADIGEGWYQWAYENWGVKWEEYDRWIVSTTDNSLHIRFDTAWAPPRVGLEIISTMFKNLTFALTYEEEGWGFAGVVRYKNGTLLQDWALDKMPEWNEDDEDAYYEEMTAMRNQLLRIAKGVTA